MVTLGLLSAFALLFISFRYGTEGSMMFYSLLLGIFEPDRFAKSGVPKFSEKAASV